MFSGRSQSTFQSDRLRADDQFVWDKFFSNKVLSGLNVRATCNACTTSISGYAYSSSNFKRHLRKKHADLMEDCENRKRSKRFKSAVVDVMDQKEFDARLVKSVVKTGVAFRLIEDDSFRDLFNHFQIV